MKKFYLSLMNMRHYYITFEIKKCGIFFVILSLKIKKTILMTKQIKFALKPVIRMVVIAKRLD
jgi:hypothetical protein